LTVPPADTPSTLEERTRYLRALFGRSPTPFVLLDRDFNFIWVNGAYARACQREVGDFPGHNHFEFYPSDARTIFEEVTRSKEPITIEARAFEFPDHPEWGVTYWDWDLTPLLDDAGEVEALAFVLEDVTSRVRPGAKSRRRSGWLEGRVLGRRNALVVTLAAAAAEVALFIGIDQFDSPSHYLGIPGAAAALIAVVAAITAGPLPGVVVALVGGAAYFAFLTDFGRTVFWPAIAISIVLWALAAWVAGVAGDNIRRRAAAREAVLSQSLTDRETLMRRLEASERRYRVLAGENERLYEQQLGIADHLQQALLNIPSDIGPLKVGHLYRSATEAARVGGDFFDVFEVKEDGVAILIGDVAGHGVEAARTATLVKDVVHAFTHQTLRPAEVLASTNQLLVEKELHGFVTVFLGILEKATGRLSYASAGHPEVLLRRAMGGIERLRSGSAPLGVFPGARWKAFDAVLGHYDWLVLYTDGIIEARHDGDFFGDERLERIVREARVPVEELPNQILGEVLSFSDGALGDDVAVLALSLTDGGEGRTPDDGRPGEHGAARAT
jgi:serine phosphatase RsbU (regulator of sigma subunit)